MAVIGLDIGTTSAKAVAYSAGGDPIGAGRAATPWVTTSEGLEMDAETLLGAARDALGQASDELCEPVTAVGITSMAESGVLVDSAGRPVAPVIAWHDGRDSVETAQLAHEIGPAEFGARTGKPLRGQWSITKHLWLRRHHEPTRRARRRFNVAEWIVRGLGGDEVTELSLACRTGWFDIANRRWWSDGLAFAGADEALMPPLVEAGQPVGAISGHDLPGVLRGAVLSVVGHDHQAAAQGAGAGRNGVEFDSCGTAEALVRTVTPFSAAKMLALAEQGVTTDWSIQPGHWSLLGGTEGGLAMQRTLGMLGVDQAGLADLDERAARAPTGRVLVEGLGSTSLTVRGINDDTTPAEVWRAAVQAATDDAARLHHAMDRIVGPIRELIVAGGWANSTMFMQVKREVLGALQRSDVAEAGTRGAAIFAARAVGVLGPGESFPRTGGGR